ncbi:hypothetical protein ACFY30_34375 [Streptomyces sp. NPDC000345]|uniref:hypothetical protein n=1 Tax=Streptomyces sp. NPDC000345 TaxID=3364537 RepID=UPI0036B3F759
MLSQPYGGRKKRDGLDSVGPRYAPVMCVSLRVRPSADGDCWPGRGEVGDRPARKGAHATPRLVPLAALVALAVIALTALAVDAGDELTAH